MKQKSRAVMSLIAVSIAVGCGTRTGLLDLASSDAGGTAGSAGSGGFGGTGGSGGTNAGGTAGASGTGGGSGYSAAKLGLGSYHTCAVRFDSAVRCWGGNQQGQLGDGTQEPRVSPATVDLPSADVVAFASGFRHNCAALATGDVYCWGENTDGQVSPDADSVVTEPVRVPIEAAGPNGVVSLAAGEYHSCAVLMDGRVLCWGSDRQGQLGIGWGYEAPPTQVPLPGPARQVTAGDFFTCVLLVNEGQQQVWCFGQNHYGQLGDGTETDQQFAVRAMLDEPVQRIDAGGFFVLASLQGEGYPPLYGWGENGAGQLGPEVGPQTSLPTAVMPSWNLVHWSAGLSHACAVRWFDDEPWQTLCWGTNGKGQLGDGTTISRAEPERVDADFEAIVVEAGLLHTCAQDLDGPVYCWGSNEFGQLGDGTTKDRTTPVRVEGL